MGGPNHTYFTYDRASGRFRPFIILRVLRMIMALAVLGAFSVALRAFGGSLGFLFAPLGGLLWPFEASKVLLGASRDLPLGSSVRF